VNVFNLLHRRLQDVIRKFGYVEPTPVQEKTIPLVLQGKNVLVTAPTGTGKTEAVMFPIISKILERFENGFGYGIQVLYVTPMRALNRDIYVRLKMICEELGISMGVRHSDTPEPERRKQAEKPPHILITTPETLQFILIAPKLRKALVNVKHVIIDEIHELVNDKRGIQLSISLERLCRIAGNFQRIGLSATIGNIELVKNFLAGIGREIEVVKIDLPKDIEIEVHRPLPKDISKAYEIGVLPDTYARLIEIDEFIKKHKSVIVFVNTRDTAELLGSRLNKIVNYEIGVYHGSLSREEREKLEKNLRDGITKAVIATSSLELGIDIGHIDAIIQYMSPRQVTRLIQRVGRSGHRIFQKAIGKIITTDLDDTLESIVIAKHAIKGDLEKEIEYHEKAFDVLTHQIIGILIEDKIDGKESKIEEIYNLITKAHPYRKLSFEEFTEVLKFLEERGYIRIDWNNRTVHLRKGTYKYYIDNASMIPDEISYTAIDIISNKSIGELDEEFISTIEIGSKIILSGRIWNIVSIDNKNRIVYLEPVKDITGAIPSWIGEEIPVPYEIAQEVTDLRFKLIECYKQNQDIKKVLSSEVKISNDTIQFITSEIEKIVKDGIEIPNSKRVVIENTGKLIIVHVGLGSKGNETLGIYLSRYLSRTSQISVGYRSDPYRVVLILSRLINPELIIKALKEVNENEIFNIIYEGIKLSRLYRYRFVHVARRFGIISKENIHDVNVGKLVEVFENSIVEKETIREIIIDKLDLKSFFNFIKSVKDGKIEFSVCNRKEISQLSTSLTMLNKIDFTSDVLPKSMIIDLVKKRIEERTITLVCLKCGWYLTTKVKYLNNDISCPKCGLRVISMLKYSNERIENVLKLIEKVRKRIPLSKDEEKYWNELKQRAAIILQYGKAGILTLSAHGIGVGTAIRKVLAKVKNEDELYLAILEAEKEYLKTRQFWD